MSNKNMISSLRFVDYVVDYIEFKTNSEFQEQSIDVHFDIDRKIEYDRENESIGYVTLFTDVFDNPVQNNYPFSLKLSITGVFDVTGVNEEEKEYFLKYNAVSILFPYVRSLISTYTTNANVPPLILPPINVLNLIDK